MGILKEIDGIKEGICNHYCKWPDKYPHRKNETIEECDAIIDRLYEERCKDCPLNRF